MATVRSALAWIAGEGSGSVKDEALAELFADHVDWLLPALAEVAAVDPDVDRATRAALMLRRIATEHRRQAQRDGATHAWLAWGIAQAARSPLPHCAPACRLSALCDAVPMFYLSSGLHLACPNAAQILLTLLDVAGDESVPPERRVVMLHTLWALDFAVDDLLTYAPFAERLEQVLLPLIAEDTPPAMLTECVRRCSQSAFTSLAFTHKPRAPLRGWR
jgi:hypothetical protein